VHLHWRGASYRLAGRCRGTRRERLHSHRPRPNDRQQAAARMAARTRTVAARGERPWRVHRRGCTLPFDQARGIRRRRRRKRRAVRTQILRDVVNMTSPSNTAAQMESIVRDLKTNSNFADLSQEDLMWLAERMEDAHFAAGYVLGRKGDPISHLNVILEGEIQVEFPEEPGTPRFIAH